MRFTRIICTLLAVMFISSTAVAQDSNKVTNDEFGVTVTAPEKWEVTQGNDKAVANFKHRGSQSQIEVVGTKLMTPDVADVFFKTFHKTLKESNFEKKEEKDTKIGEVEGQMTTYAFTHSGVTLNVTIFEFTRESSAWLVVGYMQDVEKDKYLDDFKSVVKNMAFKG